MKGFLLGSLLLIGAYVVLQAPASRLPGLFTPVTNALANWMDPAVPFITDHSGAASSTPAAAPVTNATQPGGTQRVRPKNGSCPPGFHSIGGWCYPPNAEVTPR